MKASNVLFAIFCSAVLGSNVNAVAAAGVSGTRMPPMGVEISPETREELEKEVSDFQWEMVNLKIALQGKPALLALVPDAQIYGNAVRYALEDNIFYKTNEIATARQFLAEGRERARLLREGQAPWTTATGLVVRGYVSKIDDSVQPYGLVVPESYKPGAAHRQRLDFWFHGRNEKLSEMAFIGERESKMGEFTPDDTFVLHPYGRYCNASKFAGEVDAFEALENVRKHYPIDENRIAVRGFSMGGASAWHLAAHHAGLWVAASPGAGFAETAIFQKIFERTNSPAPAWYEQRLWHLYDASDYAVNLFNCPVVAYSGEIDPQRQSAELMGKVMAAEGLKLERVIGPKTGHKFEPKAKEEVARRMDTLSVQGRNPVPKEVRFTTWTLRYNQMDWVTVDGLEKHWNRARVGAEILGADKIKVTTTNVSALTLAMPAGVCPLDPALRPKVVIDRQELAGPEVGADHSWTAHFQKQGTRWKLAQATDDGKLRKQHGLQGPIDDAFMDAFIMVRPTGQPMNEKVGAWTTNAMAHAMEAWRLQFRGEPKVEDDRELSDAEIAANNLVLWGDPRSNRVLARLASKLPIRWDGGSVRFLGKNYTGDRHVLVLIYPNPLNPKRYVVVNSGFTFADAAAKSNALQVPMLPDFAVFDISAGSVVDAGFFDEEWKLPILQ